MYGPPCGHIFVHPACQGVQVEMIQFQFNLLSTKMMKIRIGKKKGTRELESRGHTKASGRAGEESEGVVYSRRKPSTCE